MLRFRGPGSAWCTVVGGEGGGAVLANIDEAREYIIGAFGVEGWQSDFVPRINVVPNSLNMSPPSARHNFACSLYISNHHPW